MQGCSQVKTGGTVPHVLCNAAGKIASQNYNTHFETLILLLYNIMIWMLDEDKSLEDSLENKARLND